MRIMAGGFMVQVLMKTKASEKKQEAVPLPVIAKQDVKQLKMRLGNAYDKAVTEFQKNAEKEAKELNKTKSINNGKDLLAWSKKIEESSSYISVEWEVTWDVSGPIGVYESYLKKLEKADQDLDKIASIMDEAKKDKVKIILSVATTAEVDSSYLADIKKNKERFVKDTSQLLGWGFSGKEPKLYSLDLGDKDVAATFSELLNNEIGTRRPANIEKNKQLPFEKASVPKDTYPLEIMQKNSSVVIAWAQWIGFPGQEMVLTKLSGVTPKLEKRKV